MKRINLILMMALMMMAGAKTANAQSLTDLLKKAGSGSTISDVLSGVLSSSNLTVEDLAGEWKSNGPAISFKGDNFLKKAGGVAAAAAIKSKIKPYYTKYGLDNSTLSIDKKGNFEFKFNKLTLKGTIEPDTKATEKGVFLFRFKAAGKVNLGAITTYVQKTSKTMDVMFDATKLKNFVSVVAKYSGNSMAKTFSSLLEQYDGLCVGFEYRQENRRQ